MKKVTLTVEGLAHLLNTTEHDAETLVTSEGKIIEDPKKVDEIAKEKHDQNLIGFKNSRTKAFDDGFKKAQKKVLDEKETELREKYEVEGDTIDDIAESILESGKSTSKSNPSDVKNSEIYINDTKTLKKRISELEEEVKAEKSGRESDKIDVELNQSLPGILKKNKKVLSEDTETQKQQLNLIKLQLKEKGIKLKKIGEELVPFKVTDDGEERMSDDKTLKDLSLSDVVLSSALFLPTALNTGGKSPGNKNEQGGGSGKSHDFSHITNEKEYMEEVDKILGKEDSSDEEFEALQEHAATLGL